MSPPAVLSKLFNDKTYSDLVIRVDGAEWYCHKCIVFSTSPGLRDLYESDATICASDGRDCLELDESNVSTIGLMLRSMYQTVEEEVSKLDVDDGNDGLIDLFLTAKQYGLSELEQTAREALRLALERVEHIRELSGHIYEMADSTDEELQDLASEIEQERMPELLIDKSTRNMLQHEDVVQWFDSVEICNKTKSKCPGSAGAEQDALSKSADMEDLTELALGDEGLLRLFVFSKRRGYPKLKNSAHSALRLRLENETDDRKLCSAFQAFKAEHGEELIALARKVQFERMPALLKMDMTRDEVDSQTVKEWFCSVDICSKVDGSKIDTFKTFVDKETAGSDGQHPAGGSKEDGPMKGSSKGRLLGEEEGGRPTKIQRTS
jgi:hypothetical protein